MEIDIRQIPEGDRLSKVLDAAGELPPKEVLTLLMEEDPAGLIDSMKATLGDRIDVQMIRWGIKDLPWVVHVKKSLRPSAYQPE